MRGRLLPPAGWPRGPGRYALAALLACGLLARPGAAQVGASGDGPRIGLVLGGGAARGAAHVGVLKVLDELGVPVDFVVGTSMGAVVGGLYASGMGAAEIERELARIDWQDVFHDRPERRDLSFRRKQDDRDFLLRLEVGVGRGRLYLPRGLVGGQKMGVLLRALTLPVSGIRRFDELPIPFRAVATDLETGEMVVLDAGDLADAIQASLAVPGAIAPVELGGRLLVDGGVVRNLPIDVARGMGADVVIAVDVGAPLEPRERLGSALDVASQVITIVTRANARQQAEVLGPGDVLITPALDGMLATDFTRSAQAVAMGEDAAREHLPELSRLVPWRGEGAAPRPRSAPDPRRAVVDEVRVENRSPVSTAAIRRMLRARPGTELDLDRLRRDLSRIYGLGGLERVSFRIERDGARQVLVVTVEEKAWGGSALRFGLSLGNDFRRAATYHLRASYVAAHLNRLGGEARLALQVGQADRLGVELFQPVEPAGRYFVSPGVEYRREPFQVYDEAGTGVPYHLRVAGVGIFAGVQLGSWGEARAGVVGERVRAGPQDAAPGVADHDLSRRVAAARVLVDGLDDVDFPTRGGAFRLDWSHPWREPAYQRLEATAIGVESRGPHTLLGALSVGTSLGSSLPVYDQFALGGFLRLSGLPPRSRAGSYYGLARLVFLERIGAGFALVPAGAVRLGVSLEAGDAWSASPAIRQRDLRYAGSLVAGMETLLGPLYLARGLAEGGAGSWYLYLGRAF